MFAPIRRCRRLLTTTCCAALVALPVAALAQDNTTAPAGTQVAQNTLPGNSQSNSKSILPQVSANAPEQIIVRAQKLIVKEKDAPSAVTELGAAQIAETGVSGSVATLLRQVPSVYVYQQGIGDNEPVLSIRGTRGLETAQTLDGVPMQDLLNGGTGGYLQNNVAGHFNLDQISGVSVYPGVAYPDQNTFGTIGGTIAYSSKRPTNDTGVDVFGSVGSFGTYNEGFTLNSGRMNGIFGTDDNAPKMLLQYSNLQTSGFIDNTSARYNNAYFAFDKPYQGGLSDFQVTAIYNTGSGYIQSEPTPVPYLQKNGLFSNYPTSEVNQQQINDYATLIVKDDTYVNDYINVGATAFYLESDSTLNAYGNINLYDPAQNGKYIVGGAAPFVQTPAGFGYPTGFWGANGFGGPFGGLFYLPGVYTYNPTQYLGTSQCPTAAEAVACGITASTGVVHNDSYGFQPRVTIILPEIAGVANTIKIGGLVAKETQPTGKSYLGPTEPVPQTAAFLSGIGGGGGYGGTQRTIYQGYAQDKIDLLDNTLHLTPGVTLEGSYSSLINPYEFVSNSPKYPGVGTTGPAEFLPFKETKWDREWLPFFNVDYDFDKVMPSLKGLSAYGSFGESALFAPVTDFTANTSGSAPYASIVHMYEGGLKYDTSQLALNVDYFYQKVDRDFGFFQGQAGPVTGESFYSNYGQREFKGVEASAQYQITPELQLFVNGSHLLAKYLQSYLASTTIFEDQFGLAQKGTPETGVPDWLSNFGMQYDKKSIFRPSDDLSVRFAGQYTGHQYTTYDISGLETNIGNNIQGVPANLYGANGQPLYPAGYIPYLYKAGATTYDPHGGISPFAIFNLDVAYTMPTPGMSYLQNVKFDLNIQNLFNHEFYQYFYRQVSPSACGTFKSGPFAGLPESNYSCGGQFADALPGEPFAVTFTVTAHF